jgi:pimeloyl-ACP methyl ester carboxylesterase
LWRFIPRIQQPVLVVYGGQSDTFRKKSAQQLQKALPQSRFICFEDNGHFIPMEKPAAVGQAILDFVSSI